MPDVIEVVLELLHCVLVALAVGIIRLRPTGDTRFDQMPKMIKRDRLLIAFSALAPLGTRPNQADVAFECIPKLGQLIESEFSQPAPHRSHATVIFARINVFVGLVGAPAHGPEFEKNEPFAVTTNPFLPKENRFAVLYPYEHRNKHEERSAKDQCCGGGNDIEQPLQVMIGRNTSQLETSLEGPERIDNSQRKITPVRLVK